MTMDDGILRSVCSVTMSSVPWLLDGVGWLFFNGAPHAGRSWGDPGMLMKGKQLSAESKSGICPLQETKHLKLNGLSILGIGHHGEEKRYRK
jgi:hypothetical protein